MLRQVQRNKKSLTYSAVLLLGLVFVSVLLNRSVIQVVHSNSHVALTTDQSIYIEGGDIFFTGEIEFSLNEQVDIKQVSLKNVSGPTPLDTALPLAPTSGQYVNVPVASGTLMVKVDFLGITLGSSAPGTIPLTTLPGGSDELKSVTNASKSFTPANGPRPQATPTRLSGHTVSNYSLNSRTARILKAPAPTTRSSLAPWFRSPALHGRTRLQARGHTSSMSPRRPLQPQ